MRECSLSPLASSSLAIASLSKEIAHSAHARQLLDMPPCYPRFTRLRSRSKRVFDFLFTICLIVILAPLLCLVGIAVKLDSPGPILFRQPRIGFKGMPFTILKFGPMHNEMADFLAHRQTAKNDPRVTMIGKYLRRWSLDELPQLFNVIMGNMSLVGPRPHAPHTRVEGRLLWELAGEYDRRHLVLPGLTGWAQINGARGELRSVHELLRRVELDIEYIERQSLGLDLRILFLTFKREIVNASAY